ncbi:hypothetical protein GTW78_13315 [Streptomyces sp. SID4948]|nr:hypothetical protein [Streptomyces sp. SID4948]
MAVPAGSGTGERVVYSIGRGRVWLVGADERVRRTFPVAGGAVVPDLGAHRVFARRARGAGGDGAQVEHIVLFGRAEGQNVGFSAALDGSLTRLAPAKRTAAIREARPDGAALWREATLGATIQVIP